ncbi:MAG: haloalkane dehalogenase [Pseudoruegeria sp.]
MNRRNFMTTTAAIGAVNLATLLPVAAGDASVKYRKKIANIHDSKMAYVDEGAGDPIVFFHGNPTSSYLWRNVMPHLQDTHRVIAPDLIGMGDSGKPDIAYKYANHAAYLHRLLDSLDLKNATLVLHDWGGPLGFDWAMKNPDRIRALVYMETITPPSMPFESYETMGPFGDLFKAWRTEGVGEKMILQDNMFITEVLGKIGVFTPLKAEVLAEYNRYYPTPESRAPILQWPREVPIAEIPANTVALTRNIGTFLTTSDLPKLLFHATPGALYTPKVVAWHKANVPNLTTVDLGNGVHFLQEDHPDAIGTGISDWLEKSK